MRVNLICHPDTPCDAIDAIVVDVSDVEGTPQVLLRYEATGDIGSLSLPAAASPERADDLWQHTCFEAFVREAASSEYSEFNFSPSGEWAAYHFEDYRSGMRNADVSAPAIAGSSGQTHYALHVAFDLPGAPPWRLALSAVIEETNGRKSYWALAHAPGKPDFHHADAFAYELAPRERA